MNVVVNDIWTMKIQVMYSLQSDQLRLAIRLSSLRYEVGRKKGKGY